MNSVTLNRVGKMGVAIGIFGALLCSAACAQWLLMAEGVPGAAFSRSEIHYLAIVGTVSLFLGVLLRIYAAHSRTSQQDAEGASEVWSLGKYLGALAPVACFFSLGVNSILIVFIGSGGSIPSAWQYLSESSLVALGAVYILLVPRSTATKLGNWPFAFLLLALSLAL